MSFRCIRDLKIDDHGIRHLRMGDLNNDGYAELVMVQSYPMNREICAVTALDLDGNVLWQHGELLDNCNWLYSDIPVQIVDWDGDGRNEVVYVRQSYYKTAHMWCYSKGGYVDELNPTRDMLRNDPDLATERAYEYEGDAHLMVLDGVTGEVKQQIPIPAPADDCIIFGHFDGTGKLNLLAKDRYWNIWAISNEGRILWTVSDKDLKVGLGHGAAVGDIDGDGLDEVFLTNTLIDSDGTILWQIPDVHGHHDTAYILDNLPEPRIIAGGDKIRMITPDGKVLWEKDGGHLQNVYVGRFSSESKHGPYQFWVRDIAPNGANYDEGCKIFENGTETGGQRLTIYDWYGNQLYSEKSAEESYAMTIHWNGDNDNLLRFSMDGLMEIIDVYGSVIDTINYPVPDGKPRSELYWPYVADILGDSRDEIIVFGGSNISIYMNTTTNNIRSNYNYCRYQLPVCR